MISKALRILFRIHTETLPPEPELTYQSDDEDSYSDSEFSDSLTLDDLAREPPLRANLQMPIFDIETQTMDLALPKPDEPEEEPDIVGILDRTDRLGCHMPLVAMASISKRKRNEASIRRFFRYRIETKQLIPNFFGSKKIKPI